MSIEDIIGQVLGEKKMKLDLKPYKGTRDVYPEDMRVRQYIFDTWSQVVESFGYEKYDAPILEPLELYAAKTGEEIVEGQTYTFTDRGDREVAIRPEMTPSIARMVAARRQETPLSARLYSIANFMRYEQPQKGREREFWQLNFDVFGSDSISADVEIVTIADAILKKFGATDKMYTIKINDRELVDYIAREYLGLDDKKALSLVKLLDRRAKMKQEAFNEIAIQIVGMELLGKVKDLLDISSISDAEKLGLPETKLQPLMTVISKLKEKGIRAEFDITLMRGFDYYSGIVFEVFDNNPDNNRAMFGGGRYDGLVGLFGVEDLPVVGCAPGETTMLEFLTAWDLLPDLKPATDLVLVALNPGAEAVADELRAQGVNVAVDFTGRKLDKIIKSADKMGVEYVLFIGEDELKQGKYNLKNLTTSEEKSLSPSEIAKTFSTSY